MDYSHKFKKNQCKIAGTLVYITTLTIIYYNSTYIVVLLTIAHHQYFKIGFIFNLKNQSNNLNKNIFIIK